jgi:NAD(P)-dependent dehydrogenase (short-subunit alcohol dehydrogenase family)
MRAPLRAALAAALLAAAAVPAKRYFSGCVSQHRPDLTNRTYLITGANTGLGFEMARELLILNATVIVTGRDAARVAGAAARLRAAVRGADARLDARALVDLASLASVRAFAADIAARYARLDALVLNAGVMRVPRALTADGFETTLAVNHLGHHLLAALLLPALRAAGAATRDARVIAVSSAGHLWGELDAAALEDLSFERRADAQQGFAPYTQSKLANVLFAAELARREARADSGVRAFSLHPGAVRTEIFRNMGARAVAAAECLAAPFLWFFFKSPLEGAQTQLFVATAPLAALENGAYYGECAVSAQVNPRAKDAALARALWEKSDALVGLMARST